MRAFIAVVPPAEVVEELTCFLEPRRDWLQQQGQWRWTRPEHVHLTLAFLPQLDPWREESLIEDGEAWAAGATPASLRLVGAGAFPDPAQARVLWAAVEDRSGALPAWARSLRAVASRAGARVQGTRFSPHVTLARAIGRPHSAGHLVQALDTLETRGWSVGEVVLVRSHLGQGPGGTPRYEERHSWSVSST